MEEGLGNALVAEALGEEALGEKRVWQVQRVVYSHEALINQILTNPTATNIELGRIFGRTPAWVSLVRNSDLFLERLAARSAELTDPIVRANMDERLSMLTNRSLEVLLDKMSQSSEKIPDALAIAAATFGAKAKAIGGFGTRVIPETPTPSADRIERLAERLERLGGVRPPVVDVIDVETRERAAW